jgi:cytolysin-activating lysine-acyltransferase
VDEIPHKYRGIFVDIISLMAHSSIHKNWSLSEIIRVTVPPLMLNQCRVFKKNGKPIAYISWAFFNEASVKAYIKGTRKLQLSDWNSGKELWAMDFIAPFGDVAKIIRKCKKVLGGPSKSKRWKGKQVCGKYGKIFDTFN